MSFYIDNDKCVGCGACAYVCLFHVPKAADESASKYKIKTKHCLGCGQCELICPVGAIQPEPDFKRRRRVVINDILCEGCGKCAEACKTEAPRLKADGKYEIQDDHCIHCGMCVNTCKPNAIDIIH